MLVFKVREESEQGKANGMKEWEHVLTVQMQYLVMYHTGKIVMIRIYMSLYCLKHRNRSSIAIYVKKQEGSKQSVFRLLQIYHVQVANLS